MRILAFSWLCLGQCIPFCLANYVSYTYTGNHFDSFQAQDGFPYRGIYSANDYLTASFIVRSPLPPSTTYVFNPSGGFDENPTLLGWSSFDGAAAVNGPAEEGFSFLIGHVSTDSASRIASWNFVIGGSFGNIAYSSMSCPLINECWDFFSSSPLDYVQLNVGFPYSAAGVHSVGAWTMTISPGEPPPPANVSVTIPSTSSTPDPSYSLLVAASLSIFVIRRFRRIRS